MTGIRAWARELQAIDRASWPDFLEEHSGLPGPRANLALLDAVLTLADADSIAVLSANGGEYSMMCAAAAIGSRADDPARERQLLAMAADTRWRVREGVVIGLQHLGDRSIQPLIDIVQRWVDSTDVLLERAAVAAICEPRVLRTPEAKQAALQACAASTRHLATLPDDQRKAPDARRLRQSLGYCWSVAVAADPSVGLAAFRELDTTHADIAWIVAENRRKQRLAVLMA